MEARRATVLRRVTFTALYFAEGGPIGFVWWALPVWLDSAGRSAEEVSAVLAAVAWPWTLKVLFAPLVDVLRGPRFGHRAWVAVAQLGMAASLGALALADVELGGPAFVALLVAHASCAALQDAAIDSLAILTVPVHERGRVNGWMQVGMLVGRAAFGGGGVLLARRLGGHEALLQLLVVALLLPATALRLLAPLPWDGAPVRTRAASVAAAFRRALGSRATWLGLLVASTVGASYEGFASLAGPFLRTRGASEELVGTLFLVPVAVLMGVGALAGGWASDRAGKGRTVLVAEIAVALLVATTGVAARSLPVTVGPAPFVCLLGATYLAAGVATAALYALLMDRTDATSASTQFALFMGGINLCYVWSTTLHGRLVDAFGYGPSALVLAAISLAATPLLAALGRTART